MPDPMTVILRRAALCLALSLGVAAGVATPGQTQGAQTYTFAFQNAEISQVVQEVLGQADMPFVIDPAVTGKLTFRIEQRLSKEQLVAALEAVLDANGVAMVRRNDQLFITPEAKAKTTAEIRRGAPSARSSGYEIVAVPLGYAQPTEVARAMEAISAADTVLYSNDKLGLLLLGGSGQQLKSVLETLKVFDQSAFEDTKIRWFELTQAQATTVAAELERVAQGAGLVGVSIVPLKRLNGVVVFARSADPLTELAKWVQRLDMPDKDPAQTLWVYKPQFGSAESLGRTLGGLIGSVGGGASLSTGPIGTATNSQSLSATGTDSVQSTVVATPALGSGSVGADAEVRVSVDRDTNSLLLFATPAKWLQVQRILGEIDRPQRQVFIEASIVEVTLGKQFEFGVDWSVLKDKFQVSSVQNTAGLVGPNFPGLSVAYMDGDIAAALNVLGSRTSIEVISAPKIIALDNRTARLQIGDQVPIVTQSARGTTTSDGALVSTVEYRSTGVILTVTPRIAGADRLVLEVAQEVSSVARTNSSGIDSPTIQQRRFESALVIDNGRTVALGGLINTTQSAGNSGIPGLKDLPGVGGLFGRQGREGSRSELIVLLTARIITDTASADRAMADLALDMHELQRRGLLPSR